MQYACRGLGCHCRHSLKVSTHSCKLICIRHRITHFTQNELCTSHAFSTILSLLCFATQICMPLLLDWCGRDVAHTWSTYGWVVLFPNTVSSKVCNLWSPGRYANCSSKSWELALALAVSHVGALIGCPYASHSQHKCKLQVQLALDVIPKKWKEVASMVVTQRFVTEPVVMATDPWNHCKRCVGEIRHCNLQTQHDKWMRICGCAWKATGWSISFVTLGSEVAMWCKKDMVERLTPRSVALLIAGTVMPACNCLGWWTFLQHQRVDLESVTERQRCMPRMMYADSHLVDSHLTFALLRLFCT